jgi:broad specificity phosphatase PhoE
MSTLPNDDDHNSLSSSQQPSHNATHPTVTEQVAVQECSEHMENMDQVYQLFRDRPLLIRAHNQLHGVSDSSSSSSSSITKTVHFVRHGQGFHNLLADLATAAGTTWVQFSQSSNNPYRRPELLDAPLTEIGRQQAYRLHQQDIPQLSHPPELVLCSPTCRALQTSLIAFESLIGTTVPFVAHEMVREETGIHICDQRRSTSRQRQEFPQVNFDELESEDDPFFQEDVRETKLEVGHRIYTFLEWLSQRPEQHIAVVSHSGWLLTLFNAIVQNDCDPKLKLWWPTGEMRSVQLEFISTSNNHVPSSTATQNAV